MTAKYEDRNEVKKARLEDILRTVRSIDSRVENILDTMKDRNDVADCDPVWDRDHYFDAYEY